MAVLLIASFYFGGRKWLGLFYCIYNEVETDTDLTQIAEVEESQGRLHRQSSFPRETTAYTIIQLTQIKGPQLEGANGKLSECVS